MNAHTVVPASILPLADLVRQRALLQPLVDTLDCSLPDAQVDSLCGSILAIDDEILARPARTAADLAAKFVVWAHLIEDPACILEEHVALFAGFQRDVLAMMRAAA